MKQKLVVVFQENIQKCYRESRFPENDKNRNCPFGFISMSDKCANCKWFESKIKKQILISGKDVQKSINFMDKNISKK